MHRLARVIALFSACVVVACSGSGSSSETEGTGTDSGLDGGGSSIASDAEAQRDSGTDAATTKGDAGSLVAGYHAFDDPASWSHTSINDQSCGAVFDGRYVYFVGCGSSARFVRYDTTIAFGTPGAIVNAFMPAGVAAASAAFDGRYIYFDNFYRFDTTQSPTDATAFTSFQPSTIGMTTTFHYGVSFDGRYVYYAPSDGGSVNQVVRYDTTSAYQTSTSWSLFDVGTLPNAPGYFQGVVFDGRYEYFVPLLTSAHPYLARYDTQATFASASSWNSVDIHTFESSSSNGEYRGGIFDGRYLYVVPTVSSTLLRYDTTAAFTDSASWNAGPAESGSGAFDGRYLYFIPSNVSSSTAEIDRFDTTSSDMTDPNAWETHALLAGSNPGDANAAWVGGAFDGRYLYLAPYGTTEVWRLDSRYPAATPPGYKGSFF